MRTCDLPSYLTDAIRREPKARWIYKQKYQLVLLLQATLTVEAVC